MPGGRETRHVDPDLRHDNGGGDGTDAGDGGQPSGSELKGGERGAHLCVDLGDGLLQRRDLVQVQLEQKPVMGRHVPPQCFDDVGARGLDPGTDERGELVRAGLAADDGGQDRATALAHDVGQHRAELEVRVLEHLVDALDMGRPPAYQLLAGPGQRAQLLDRRRRHEASPNQAVRQQICDPHRVIDVRLAAGDVLDVHRVGQDEIKSASRTCHTGRQ
jgi:hypothetical protein